MEKIDRVMMQRIEARKAEAHLNSILELFYQDTKGWNEMDDKIKEFMKWIWEESPIS